MTQPAGEPFAPRLATAADVPMLAALYALCARTFGPQVYAPEQVRAWASFGADTPRFRDYILDARTWLLPADDATQPLPRGFCGVADSGEVHSLYVHPACGRQGLGQRLLACALADARGRGQTRFAAWATPLSRPVFERAGLPLTRVVSETFEGVMFQRYRVGAF